MTSPLCFFVYLRLYVNCVFRKAHIPNYVIRSSFRISEKRIFWFFPDHLEVGNICRYNKNSPTHIPLSNPCLKTTNLVKTQFFLLKTFLLKKRRLILFIYCKFQISTIPTNVIYVKPHKCYFWLIKNIFLLKLSAKFKNN